MQGQWDVVANALDAPVLRAHAHHADWTGRLLSHMDTCLKQAPQSADLEVMACASLMLFLEPGHARALDMMLNLRHNLPLPVSAVYQRFQQDRFVSRSSANEAIADGSVWNARWDLHDA